MGRKKQSMSSSPERLVNWKWRELQNTCDDNQTNNAWHVLHHSTLFRICIEPSVGLPGHVFRQDERRALSFSSTNCQPLPEGSLLAQSSLRSMDETMEAARDRKRWRQENRWKMKWGWVSIYNGRRRKKVEGRNQSFYGWLKFWLCRNTQIFSSKMPWMFLAAISRNVLNIVDGARG